MDRKAPSVPQDYNAPPTISSVPVTFLKDFTSSEEYAWLRRIECSSSGKRGVPLFVDTAKAVVAHKNNKLLPAQAQSLYRDLNWDVDYPWDDAGIQGSGNMKGLDYFSGQLLAIRLYLAVCYRIMLATLRASSEMGLWKADEAAESVRQVERAHLNMSNREFVERGEHTAYWTNHAALAAPHFYASEHWSRADHRRLASVGICIHECFGYLFVLDRCKGHTFESVSSSVDSICAARADSFDRAISHSKLVAGSLPLNRAVLAVIGEVAALFTSGDWDK